MAGSATTERHYTATSATPVDANFLKTDYKVHPSADMWPLIGDSDLRAMAEDIAENGLQEPIWMYDGQVLDGRNRLIACSIAGVKPTFQQWTPRHDGDTPTTFIMSRNMHRRHLTQSQRATVAVRIEAVIAEENRRLREEHRQREEARRQREGAFSSPASQDPAAAPGLPKTTSTELRFTGSAVDAATPQRAGVDSALASPFSAPTEGGRLKTGRARDQAAFAVGVSPAYANDAKNLQKANPALFDEVASGSLTLPQAQEQAVRQAIDEGTVETSGLRAGVVRQVLTKIENHSKRQAEPRERIKVTPKFSKVQSSAVSVQITVTFGHSSSAEEYLNRMQDDPRVKEMTFEVVDAPKR